MSRRPSIEEINAAARPGESTSEVITRLLSRGSLKQSDINPLQMFLPGFGIGSLPNHLNRSSLIAPIARRKRKFHQQTEMVTRKDCVLIYTGEQLDEADGDLIMALIATAQPYTLGKQVPLNRAELLRKIHRETGKSQYEWLMRAMKRLREGVIFLEARKPDGTTRYVVGKLLSFNLLKDLEYDDKSGTYTFSLDPRWVKLFGNSEYSRINWSKRMQMGRNMGKTLQRLLATSSDPVQRYALGWLKDKMSYESPMRKFREALSSACDELKQLEILTEYKLEISTRGQPQLAIWLRASA